MDLNTLLCSSDPNPLRTALFRTLKTRDPKQALQALHMAKSLDLSGLAPFPGQSPAKTPPVSLAPLGALTQLETLKLDWQTWSDAETLSRLTQLKTLTASGCHWEAPVQWLHSLTSLETLEWSDNPQCPAPLEGFPGTRLKTLKLSRCRLREWPSLPCAAQIENLDLSENDLTSSKGLSAFSGLKKLNIARNMLDDISPLSAAKSLRSLHAAHNRIDSLEPLQDLGQLETLDVTGNRIRQLKHLRNLSLLFQLGIGQNPIDEDDLERLPRGVRLL